MVNYLSYIEGKGGWMTFTVLHKMAMPHYLFVEVNLQPLISF